MSKIPSAPAPNAPIAQIEISKLKYASEAPKELGLKVRQSDDSEGLPTLEASIRTIGIIMPLVVKRHEGSIYVTGGNRRLKLLRKIHGESTPGVIVPTLDTEYFDGDDREVAMATNIALPPHPVDRYEVISTLVKEGMTPADAQARFGMTPRQYAQTMRLGMMAPIVREAWRSGEIDNDVVKAFALTDDIKEQERIFNLEKKSDWKHTVHAHAVANRLVKQFDAGPLVTFVGIDACEGAKIKVNQDLFGARHTVSDMKALKRLAENKLSEVCDALTKMGWAWALPEEDVKDKWQYNQAEPSSKIGNDQARIEQIDQLLTADDTPNKDRLAMEKYGILSSTFGKVQRSHSGCFVKIAANGTLHVELGKIRPADKKTAAASEATDSSKPVDKKKKKPGTDVATAALAGRLSETLTKAAATAIVREPALAISALIAGFASRDFSVGVSITGDQSRPADFAQTFASALKGSDQNRSMLLAQIAGRALAFDTHNPESVPLKKPSIGAICNALSAKAMNAALRECFDAKDYFASVGKEAIFQAVLEAMGSDHATKVAKMKRGDGAKFALANVPKTGWLPPWLRTTHYDGPKPVAAKKVKAKAPKKVPAKKKVAKKSKRR